MKLLREFKRKDRQYYANHRFLRSLIHVKFLKISRRIEYLNQTIRCDRWLCGRQINDVAKTENSPTSAVIYHLPDEIIFGRIIFLRAGVRIMSHTGRMTNKGFGYASRLLYGVNEVHEKDGSLRFTCLHTSVWKKTILECVNMHWHVLNYCDILELRALLIGRIINMV